MCKLVRCKKSSETLHTTLQWKGSAEQRSIRVGDSSSSKCISSNKIHNIKLVGGFTRLEKY
jgi:hypothetical protein